MAGSVEHRSHFGSRYSIGPCTMPAFLLDFGDSGFRQVLDMQVSQGELKDSALALVDVFSGSRPCRLSSSQDSLWIEAAVFFRHLHFAQEFGEEDCPSERERAAVFFRHLHFAQEFGEDDCPSDMSLFPSGRKYIEQKSPVSRYHGEGEKLFLNFELKFRSEEAFLLSLMVGIDLRKLRSSRIPALLTEGRLGWDN
jgi:hypothetical protein